MPLARLVNSCSELASLTDFGSDLHLLAPTKLNAFCPKEVFVLRRFTSAHVRVLWWCVGVWKKDTKYKVLVQNDTCTPSVQDVAVFTFREW